MCPAQKYLGNAFVRSNSFLNGWFYRKSFNWQNVLDHATCDQVTLYEVKLALAVAE